MIQSATKPIWPDQCRHGPECFVGSCEAEAKRYDVYFFDNGGLLKVCLRYSDELSEYVSPGLLVKFMEIEDDYEPYKSARELIKRVVGDIKWHERVSAIFRMAGVPQQTFWNKKGRK